MNLKTKLLGVLAAGAVATQAIHTRRADSYRQSLAIHHEMSKATRMDWGNPLPFKSEILTKWGSRKRKL